ncbi:MAG TPA: aminoglycoside 3'-phosphotransferase, partial [Armatimonadota bacterium]
SLLNITGPPESWQLNEVGRSGARVYYLPRLDAWLKCASSGLQAEADALRYLQGNGQAPRLLQYLETTHGQYLLTSSLPGSPLCAAEILAKPEAVIRLLAGALRELHALAVQACPLDQRLTVKWRAWPFTPEETAWLAHDPPPEDLVVTHGDACLPNFHYDAAGYTGCLDLGDAGVADRWQDLALSLWSLQYNLGTIAWGLPFLAAYGIAPDARKIEYYLRLNRMDCLDVL